MDRRLRLVPLSATITTLVLLAIAAPGCKSGLESIALLWKGYDVPPEYDGLKDAKVAIVCKTVTMEEFNNAGVARQLSEALCERLKANNKKIHFIEPQKVARLLDEKGIEDPVEIGKQLKADKVLAIDIESFGVLDGQTLYRGKSTVRLRVIDVATKEVEFHKQPPQIEWPSYGSTPASDMSEPEFRNRFIAVVADQLGRNFYGHDRFAKDDDNNR